MKRIATYLGISLACIGLFAWWYFQPKRVVQRRVMALVSTLDFPADSGRTARLMKANRLGDFFTSEVLLETPFPEVGGSLSREEISSGYLFVMENASSITLKPEEDMKIRINGDQAEVRFHLHAVATVGRWLKPVNGRYTVEMHWQKTADGWQIKKSLLTE